MIRFELGSKVKMLAQTLLLAAFLVLSAGGSQAQTAQSQTTPAQTTPAQTTPALAAQQGTQASTPVKRKVRRRVASTQYAPVVAAAPARPAASVPVQTDAAAEARQRDADAKLLAQQQAQSDKAAKVNDEQVRRAEQRQDAQQNEIRIQDAPGPAQTGVVPAAGPPAQSPQQTDQRIQDQPSAVPGQNSTPQTPPQS